MQSIHIDAVGAPRRAVLFARSCDETRAGSMFICFPALTMKPIENANGLPLVPVLALYKRTITATRSSGPASHLS
jgi:hypothetical protein